MTPLVYARIGISLSATKRFIHEILLYPRDSPSSAVRRLQRAFVLSKPSLSVWSLLVLPCLDSIILISSKI